MKFSLKTEKKITESFPIGNYKLEIYDELEESLDRVETSIKRFCHQFGIDFDMVDMYPVSKEKITEYVVKIFLPKIWFKDKLIDPKTLKDVPSDYKEKCENAARCIIAFLHSIKETYIPDDPTEPLSPYLDDEVQQRDPSELVIFRFYCPLFDPDYKDE